MSNFMARWIGAFFGIVIILIPFGAVVAVAYYIVQAQYQVAGLFGLVAVAAASFIYTIVNSDDEDEEDESDPPTGD